MKNILCILLASLSIIAVHSTHITTWGTIRDDVLFVKVISLNLPRPSNSSESVNQIVEFEVCRFCNIFIEFEHIYNCIII